MTKVSKKSLRLSILIEIDLTAGIRRSLGRLEGLVSIQPLAATKDNADRMPKHSRLSEEAQPRNKSSPVLGRKTSTSSQISPCLIF